MLLGLRTLTGVSRVGQKCLNLIAHLESCGFLSTEIISKVKNSITFIKQLNPTWEGVQIMWIGGGGAKLAPPKKSMKELCQTPGYYIEV